MLTCSPKAREVEGVDQAAGAAVLDLVLDAADAARDHGPSLPHRLCHGQPEALGEPLLGDDVGAALHRVDDRGVLLGVFHRQQRQVHAAAHIRRQVTPRGLDLGEYLGSLGVVGRRRATSGPASTRCGASLRREHVRQERRTGRPPGP